MMIARKRLNSTLGVGRSVYDLRDSHFSMRFAKRNGLLDIPGRIQNANLARPKACAVFRVVDRLILFEKDRLNAGRFEDFPARPCGTQRWLANQVAPRPLGRNSVEPTNKN